ncbi:MAG TPA: response regulator [Burkholderiaceae bacterium]
MRILLVEDNRPLAEWLARTLAQDKYTVDCAYNGEDADGMLLTESYELAILDLSLPRLGGRDVLKRLRERHDNLPVLVLTADNSLEGRVVLLNAGADDYMAKPFEVSELEARIRALLRRSSQNKNPVLQCGALNFDSNSREFSIGGTALPLTPREHAVLETLMTRTGKTVSKQALADSLFALDEEVSTDAIEVYVHRLRKKLEDSGAAIITLRGLGYLLKPSHVD